MTTNQNNKFSMYSAALSVLSAHCDKTVAIPAFATAYQHFDGLVSQIREKDKERFSKTFGKMAVKDEAEDALVMATVLVSSALVAFARAKGNTQLKDTVRIPESTLRHVRANEQLNLAKMVYDLAKGNEKELPAYGVTATMLDDLKARIAAYDAAIRDVASGMAERSGARTAVSDLFVQADETLKEEVDPLMQMLRVTDPEFYNDYRAARVIKDIGVRHGKNAAAKPPVTGQPN